MHHQQWSWSLQADVWKLAAAFVKAPALQKTGSSVTLRNLDENILAKRRTHTSKELEDLERPFDAIDSY